MPLQKTKKTKDGFGPDLFEQIFESMGLMIAYMNRDFDFIRVNRAYAIYGGKDVDFFPGKNHFQLYPSAENKEIFNRVVATGHPFHIYEKPFDFAQRSERKTAYWDWVLKPVKEPDGFVSGLVLILADATERRHTRRALSATEKSRRKAMSESEAARRQIDRLASVIDQAAEGIAVVKKTGAIDYVNAAFEKLSGYHRTEIIGQNLRLLDYDPDAPDSSEARWDRVRSGETWSGRLMRRRKTGETYEADVTITPVWDEEHAKDIREFAIVERDVTHEVALEKKLRRAQRLEALGNLAGGIAHDLNNILMPITINTELVIDALEDGDPNRSLLQKALIAARRGRELIKQVVTFNRVADEERSPMHLRPVIHEALDLVDASLPSNIRFTRRIEVFHDVVEANPAQIHQILLNLCSNAVIAMRERGGVLEVALEDLELPQASAKRFPGLRGTNHLRLTVRDTGSGIDERIIDKIFDPFFSTRIGGGGTGMGLAVVHGVVSSHGGAVDVRSAVDKGTEFQVYLPLSNRVPRAPAQTEDLLPAGCERILVVDDDDTITQSVRSTLQPLGYDVVIAASGTQALDILCDGKGSFDLIFTDQMMPGLTGTALADELATMQETIPIIICTGNLASLDGEITSEPGIREVMLKPLTAKELAQAVRKVLNDVSIERKGDTCHG